ncbi:hypothetical protein [Mucilaginibacter sp.]
MAVPGPLGARSGDGTPLSDFKDVKCNRSGVEKPTVPPSAANQILKPPPVLAKYDKCSSGLYERPGEEGGMTFSSEPSVISNDMFDRAGDVSFFLHPVFITKRSINALPAFLAKVTQKDRL